MKPEVGPDCATLKKHFPRALKPDREAISVISQGALAQRNPPSTWARRVAIAEYRHSSVHIFRNG
jgi:hypothetical protein